MSAMLNDRLTIDDAGKPQPLSSVSQTVKVLQITALRTNSQLVFLGNHNVLATSGDERGIELHPGQRVTFTDGEIDLSKLYLDARVADEGIFWWAEQR